MSIILNYGGEVSPAILATNKGEPLLLTQAFGNSVYPGVFLEVTEQNARDNANPVSKDKDTVGVFGEVEIEEINADDWDFDFQHGKGAFALALLKMTEALKDTDFSKDNHGRKFGDPDNGSTYVWQRDIIDEEEGVSIFFVYPDKHTQEDPRNGFYLNIEENIKGRKGENKGPGFTVTTPYKMPEENDFGVEQLIKALAKTLREQNPDAYNRALKEVMEEVTEYGYEHADTMSFVYKGSEGLEFTYADKRPAYNASWEELSS